MARGVFVVALILTLIIVLPNYIRAGRPAVGDLQPCVSQLRYRLLCATGHAIRHAPRTPSVCAAANAVPVSAGAGVQDGGKMLPCGCLQATLGAHISTSYCPQSIS
ncbi:uncharacterized protein LOC144886916 [Branchiostoma floridae x Branchiostoma japonicum]